MFDYYALPNDFPGWAESLRIADKYSRIEHLEKAMKEDIKDRRNSKRWFLPICSGLNVSISDMKLRSKGYRVFLKITFPTIRN